MNIILRFIKAYIKHSTPLSQRRLDICRSCLYVNKTMFGTHTCGTLDLLNNPPVIGSDVIYKNRKIHLCGCVMEAKTKEADAICPAGKWR